MENVQKQLNQNWRVWRKKNYHKTVMSNFPYEKEKLNMIRIALCFWQFVKSIEWHSNEMKREFLMNFVQKENPLLALVAKMEMLPDKIWRKILWRHNIDFLSLESFLRRITVEQRAAIDQNWEDIYGARKRTPSVLKLTVRDRILLLIYFVMRKFGSTIADYSDSIIDTDNTRYQSKGAWAYNLARLDFGFAKYPDGVVTDKEIENRSALRFMSTKNHVNDFVVNLDDGIYWFMYKFARSYMWIFKDPQNVKLSPWICPGFWKTLLLNAWFWLGPLSFVLLLTSSDPSWYKIVFMLTASALTIFWLIILVIVVGYRILWVIYKALDKLTNHVGYVIWASVKAGLITLTIAVVGFILMHGIVYLFEFFTAWYREFGMMYARVWTVLSLALTVYTLSLALHWCAYKLEIALGENDVRIVKSRWFLKAFIVYFLFWVAFIIGVCRVQFFEALIVGIDAVKTFFLYLFDNRIIIAGSIGLSISIFFMSRSLLDSLEFEERFLLQKKRNLLMIIIGMISGIALVYDMPANDLIRMVIGIVITYYVLCSFLIISTLHFLSQDDVVYVRKRSTQFLYKESQNLGQNLQKMNPLYRKLWLNKFMRLIEANSYLKQENVDTVLEKVWSLSERIFFNNSFYSLKFFRMMILKVNKTNIDQMLKYGDFFYLNLSEDDFPKVLRNYDNRLYFFELILDGYAHDEALKLVSERVVTARQEKSKKGYLLLSLIKTGLKGLGIFFGWVWWPFSRFFRIIRNFFGDLWSFGRMMYKDACPYVQKPEKL